MASKQSTAVATTKENANAVAVPEFMQGVVGAQSNIDSSDLEIPRLKLIQSTSKEVEDGVRPGSLYHHIAEVALDAPLKIIPVYAFKSYFLWRPMEDGGGILARAPDAVHWNPSEGEFKVKILKGTKEVTWKLAKTVKESGLDLWGSEDPDNKQSPPAATLMYNVVCFLPDYPDMGLVVLTFQKGTLKVGKRFLSKLGLSRVPSFGQIFELGTEKTRNPNNQEFWTFTVTGAGLVQDANLFKELAAQNEHMSKTAISIVGAEDLQAEGAATGGESAVDGEVASRL